MMLGILLALSMSCKKYINGDPLCEWSIEKNLTKVWKCEMVFYPENGTDVSASWGDHTLEFTAGHTFQKISLASGSTVLSGAWSFDNKKQNIILTTDAHYGGWIMSYQYKILKIHKTALWVEYQTQSPIEAHYTA